MVLVYMNSLLQLQPLSPWSFLRLTWRAILLWLTDEILPKIEETFLIFFSRELDAVFHLFSVLRYFPLWTCFLHFSVSLPVTILYSHNVASILGLKGQQWLPFEKAIIKSFLESEVANRLCKNATILCSSVIHLFFFFPSIPNEKASNNNLM